jgi:1,4-dihydroxy-2-naphthoate octaprenyltransferase
MGSLACAILITNNLRDLPQDAKSGKQTLAVKIGDTSTRRLYIFLLFVAFISVAGLSYWRSASVITLTAGIFAITPMRTILSGAKGLDLIPVLTDTSKILMAFSVFLTFGLTISS